GQGKTTCIRKLLEMTTPRDSITLIHDDSKRDAQYSSTVTDDWTKAAPDAEAVTVRGDPFTGKLIDPEYVAELALQIARAARVSVRLVIDELDRACTPGGRELAGEKFRECL